MSSAEDEGEGGGGGEIYVARYGDEFGCFCDDLFCEAAPTGEGDDAVADLDRVDALAQLFDDA